jgi:hypothetical protein
LDGAGERLLFLRTCVLAPFVPVVMRMPLPWVSRLMTARLRSSRKVESIPPERVAQIVELAQSRAHPFVRAGCLTRGVSLLWLLRRRGVDVELAFGIGAPTDHDHGHCWLVLDGEPYLERREFGDRFIEVWRIPKQVA